MRNADHLLSTATTNWPSLTPTPIERAMGRFMRAPDGHDGGDGGGDAGDAGGGDNAGDDAAAGGDKGAGADGGTDAGGPGGEADAGDAAGDDGDSLLGGAKTDADAGSGDDGEAGGEDEADGSASDDEAAAGPPETYDLKVEVEGEDGKPVPVEIDTKLVEVATPVFKELGLTNEQANKLAPLAIKVQERLLEQEADNHTAMKKDWAAEVMADPELGGKNWKETERLMAVALDTFGARSVKDEQGNETNEFRALLNQSGLGNKIELVRMFAEIGKRVGEDGELVVSDANRKIKKSDEEILYPDDVKK